MISFDNDWDELLAGEFEKPYYKKLRSFLADEYRQRVVYPSMYDIFNALKFTPYSQTKVVILGQDPYHGRNQANGLCFSVKDGVQMPPSLVNIFKEIKQDIGKPLPESGNLERWGRQGVLLLNTVLTVRESAPNSHRGVGWEIFTDKVIESLNERIEPIVFMLWGANAKAKAELITSPWHKILTAAHPSPLSANNGFFGCRHFSKANEFLQEAGVCVIEW